MITTIISNNCTGGAVCHELGMEFRTPTINLQILPEDYSRFCTNLGEYMEKELYEARLLLQQDREKLFKMFGGIPDFPIGNVGDVLVCFQHYGTFQEAKEKWNERKAKIDYDHIGYIFHARGEEYKAEAEQVMAGLVANKLRTNEDGTRSLIDCCAVAGLGGNPYRDGTYSYYVHELIRDDDPKGVAPLILAALELAKIQ